MIHFDDPASSDKVRAALKEEHKKGGLEALAKRSGIAGGVTELRRLMNSEGEMTVIDRGMLGMFLKGNHT